MPPRTTTRNSRAARPSLARRDRGLPPPPRAWKNPLLQVLPKTGFMALLLAAGCATGRLADLRDCGRLSLGVGPGLDATAKLGCLAHPSLGIASRTRRVGLENRHRFGSWREEQVVWPAEILVQALGGMWGVASVPLASYERSSWPDRPGAPDVATSWLPVLQAGRAPNPFAFRELTDLEFGASVWTVSVRAGVNPLEILDFLLGFAGFDLARDDAPDPAPPTP